MINKSYCLFSCALLLLVNSIYAHGDEKQNTVKYMKIDRKMDNIYFTIEGSEVSVVDGTPVYSQGIPFDGKVPLPINSDVTLEITDGYKIEDIEWLCKISPFVFKGLDYTTKIRMVDGSVEEILKVLKSQKSLNDIFLGGVVLDAKELRPIIGMNSLSRLRLNRCYLKEKSSKDDLSLGDILQKTKIREISFEKCDGEHKLSGLTKVASLQEIKAHIWVSELSDLGKNQGIRKLSLIKMILNGENDPDAKSLNAIGNLENLEELFISTRGIIPDFSFLDRLPRLKKLTIYNAPIPDKDLPHITNLKNLEELNVTDYGPRQMEKIRSLKHPKIIRIEETM